MRSWTACMREKHRSVVWPGPWWNSQWAFGLYLDNLVRGFGGGLGASSLKSPLSTKTLKTFLQGCPGVKFLGGLIGRPGDETAGCRVAGGRLRNRAGAFLRVRGRSVCTRDVAKKASKGGFLSQIQLIPPTLCARFTKEKGFFHWVGSLAVERVEALIFLYRRHINECRLV